MFAAALVLVLGCASLAVAQEADADLGRSLAQAWEDAFNAGDFDALAMLYTEDALWVNASGLVFSGRDAIAAYAAAIANAGFDTVVIEHVDNLVGADLSYAHGTHTFTNADGVESFGYYLGVLMRDGDTWRLVRHMAANVAPQE